MRIYNASQFQYHNLTFSINKVLIKRSTGISSRETARQDQSDREKKFHLSARNKRWSSSANSGSSTASIRPSANLAATSRMPKSAACTGTRELECPGLAARRPEVRATQSRRSTRRHASGSRAAARHEEQAREAPPESRSGTPTRATIATRRSCCSSAHGRLGGIAMDGWGARAEMRRLRAVLLK